MVSCLSCLWPSNQMEDTHISDNSTCLQEIVSVHCSVAAAMTPTRHQQSAISSLFWRCKVTSWDKAWMGAKGYLQHAMILASHSFLLINCSLVADRFLDGLEIICRGLWRVTSLQMALLGPGLLEQGVNVSLKVPIGEAAAPLQWSNIWVAIRLAWFGHHSPVSLTFSCVCIYTARGLSDVAPTQEAKWSFGFGTQEPWKSYLWKAKLATTKKQTKKK